MTYRPEKRIAFGPPLKERLPALLYFTFAIAVSGVIVYGQNAPSNSAVFQYVVEGDRHRLVSSSVCAIILFVSALAAVLREQMRGVVVHPDGIELRELLGFGLPRVRRFAWSQIDRMSVPPAQAGGSGGGAAKQDEPSSGIRLDLWDGSRTWLPDVGDKLALSMVLERVALARAIPIEGGTGMLDDLGNPLQDDG
ncbi:hypothetical protein SOCE26_099120 [Sorangium cellulosum]|uniref:PH domain-containing protein n=1 Tax=Sorangium cellulosum TaxID=56 RepID=A0A2L0F9W1_SORCE|nr:hypothetical protein [Sorangium cellulosum]AUX48378.1 hypothetical protein SOCE26_099120 [Sorangium cellulosum]